MSSWAPVQRIVAAPPAVLLSCEHASNELPPGYAWPEEDAWITSTHWAWDPGAADMTRAIAARLRAPAVLSRFSRLVIDPNRPLDSDTLVRGVAEGREIALNRGVTAEEVAARVALCWRPYHAELDVMVAAHPGVDLLSMHSFTPVYEGAVRRTEVGVLFDDDEAWAEAWFDGLQASGLRVARNDPWSGRGGFMYSAQEVARRYGRRAIELEIRQDLACDPEVSGRLVRLIAEVAERVGRG
ncbi:MAG TPA: N-formylglutamate amidohydrolase [Myxococcota bacterium]|nr:N-formylglutamate amidohydrolase [Myxococcota bacterium]